MSCPPVSAATCRPAAPFAGTFYGGGGGGYGDSYGGERRPKQMYAAVCADCGKTAQVPFQPTGARPVYCSDCFQSHR